MSKLVNATYAMLGVKNESERVEAEHRFVEVLAFSDFNEITAMLDQVLTDKFMEFPVWARILSFRLASLLQPNNSEIRRRAAADLRCFGPDWDLEADELDRQAAEIETGAAST